MMLIQRQFLKKDRHMGRFFFDLQGQHSASDPSGLPFDNELDAFRAAQRFAAEIASTRPSLRGNTWVAVLPRKRDSEAFCISV
ncbi:DUF6894 family protein [Bradyrhizobium sp. JYMT SZCCT0428]|uniref:DUF6894 family protein n=1 Tax=Bradyrhizobium sp. JYMT SZCCT0428 TaxID=2807673 RepID=UPI003908B247